MKNKSKLKSQNSKYGWLFISPFLIGFALIYVWLFIDSIVFSVSNLEMTENGLETSWLGIENYNEILFKNPDFNKTVFSSVGQMLVLVPLVVIFSLFIAVLLNKNFKGRAFFRSVFFIPVIISTGILLEIDQGSTLVSSMLSGGSVNLADDAAAAGGLLDINDLQAFFSDIPLTNDLMTYVVSAVNNIYNVVNSSGIQILIFLAGLQSISPSVYESASIEGASGWETFWKITFPMISPIIYLNLIYSIIDNFTNQSNSVIKMINSLAFSAGGQYGVASAMAWLYGSIITVIVLLVVVFAKKLVFYRTA